MLRTDIIICHSDPDLSGEESKNFFFAILRFFTPLRSVQNDTLRKVN